MNEKKKCYSFLFETTSVVSSSEIKILEEQKTESGRYPKVVIEARLQTIGNVNGNGRIYSSPVGNTILEQLSPKATSRNLLMEVDHPMASGDPESFKRRAAIVEIKNCGALIRKVKRRGDDIIGEIETLSGFKGPDLSRLILDDKVDIGFSLRALGGVSKRDDGITEVMLPIKAITYDVVSNPSHANAKTLQFLPESVQEYMPQSQSTYLFEDSDLTLLGEDQITICDGNSSIVRFLDDLIEEQFNAAIRGKLVFRF